jgi:hypothetical protein
MRSRIEEDVLVVKHWLLPITIRFSIENRGAQCEMGSQYKHWFIVEIFNRRVVSFIIRSRNPVGIYISGKDSVLPPISGDDSGLIVSKI